MAIDINSDTNIKAAMYPVLHINNMTYIRGSEAEMVGHDCLDQFATLVQMGKISDLLIPVSQFMENIRVLFLCGGICDLPAKQATTF